MPGVIEIDILDSFKMLCRRLGRMINNSGDHSKDTTTISTDKLRLSK
jgi:hypothetical protein